MIYNIFKVESTY